MKIKIPFNGWSRARLRKGVKTCTSRTEALGLKGDTFEVEGQKYELTGVNRRYTFDIVHDLYEREGAKNAAEMERVLRGVLGTKELPVHLYVHFFRRVEAT